MERTTAHSSWLGWVIRSTHYGHSGERGPRRSHSGSESSLDRRDVGARLDLVFTAAGCVRPTTHSSHPIGQRAPAPGCPIGRKRRRPWTALETPAPAPGHGLT